MSFSVCKFYSYNRNCKFGKNCRYLHSEASQRPPPYKLEESNNGAVNKSSDPPQINQSQVHCVETDTGDTNHEASLNPSFITNQSRTYCETPVDHTDEDASRSLIPPTEVVTSNSENTAVTQPRNICRYFKQHGYCAFGRNCRFLHDNVPTPSTRFTPTFSQNQNVRKHIPPRFQRKKTISPPSAAENFDSKDSCTPSVPQAEQGNLGNGISTSVFGVECIDRGTTNASRANGKMCKYFKSGYCSRGRRCMFVHHREDKVKNGGEASKELSQDTEIGCDTRRQSSIKEKFQSRCGGPVRQAGVLPQVVQLSDFQIYGTEKYRQFDVNYLKKRFQAVICGGNDVDEENFDETESKDLTMEMVFSPSDPDWPFDIGTFVLELTLPQNYPEKAMSVIVPLHKQDLPETLRKYLEVCMNEWISDRKGELIKNNKAELMVRPFFRWLDRNIEDVMTEALKQLKRELAARAAGFEFIPATHLKAKYTVNDGQESRDGASSPEGSSDSLAEYEDETSDECLESDNESEGSDEDEEEEDEERQPALALDTERKGTEIHLRHLQLKHNASSLLFEKLHLLIQCARCKHHSEITVGGEKAKALTCEKCNQEMFVQYRPTLAHQFSSVVGYLDLDNSSAFDLIFPDCKIVVSCLGCGKLTKINGMTSGQMIDGWCQACNAKFKFAVEAVKFYQLQPSGLDEEKKKQAEVSRPKSSKKPPKDPAIREGQPLPNFGTCRHYKQSYRWLRFPCCGKAYPCDVCHDKKEDHEMTLANRMICGHCCKEQNYSASRPCTSCGHHMTKVRTAHWEGGSGCRDRIAMSHNDQQKYKNMNKTISRKKRQSAGGAKKKNTKLRHA